MRCKGRSDGTRNRVFGVTGPHSDALRSPLGVVSMENGLQSVGDPVGGTVRSRQKVATQAKFSAGERRDRTQEVAGSSPASSMKPPQNGGFSLAMSEWQTSRRSVREVRSDVLNCTAVGVLQPIAKASMKRLPRRSRAYSFLSGAWPFGVVEAIWTAVAAPLRSDAGPGTLTAAGARDA